MTSSKTAKLTLVIVALVAAFALMVGCGGSGSQQMTLEKYVADNQAEWDKTVDEIKAAAASLMDVDMSVSGNKISQIMKFKETYPAADVEAMKANLDTQFASLKATASEQIKSMEEATGIQGISWYFEYQNGDGTTIGSLEVDANTK